MVREACRGVTAVVLDLEHDRSTIPLMAHPSNGFKHWAWISGGLFVVAHLVLVLGLQQVFDSFVALTGGVIVGLGAYASYRFHPALWRNPWAALVVGGVIATEWSLFDEAMRPPPPPEPLAIMRAGDGTYRLNRGGRMQLARVYFVLPEPAEERTCPTVLGAVRVTRPLDDTTSRVDWIVVRSKYAGRAKYPVRPLRPGESPPSPSKFATLTPGTAPGRVVLDVGSAEGVKVDQVYALYHPGGRGRAGYAVVDALSEHTSEGYLAMANPTYPHDADRIGVLKNVLQYAMTQAEVDYLAGDLEAARHGFQEVLELSKGTNQRAIERLSTIDARL